MTKSAASRLPFLTDPMIAVLVIATRSVLATDSNGDGIPEKGDGSNLQNCESP